MLSYLFLYMFYFFPILKKFFKGKVPYSTIFYSTMPRSK